MSFIPFLPTMIILPKPQGHVQVLLNMLRGFTPQAALDAPRFCISAGTPDAESNTTGAAGDFNSEIYFEDGFSRETIDTLKGAFLNWNCSIQKIHISQRWVMMQGSLMALVGA
jgi:hypothetical protein